MLLGNRHYTRAEILARIGNISQLGGLRHSVLSEGRGKGMRTVQFNTGAGLILNVMPDRGLDIFHAGFRGHNLVHHTATGEAHPAFHESAGEGWMRLFFGGLMTTCGLTTIGPPGMDGDEPLGMHGRYTAIPAARVSDLSGWVGDEYRLELRGVLEDATPIGHMLRLTRSIKGWVGSNQVVINDHVENFGFEPAPLCILYHMNFGFPLLDTNAELLFSSDLREGYEAYSASRLEHYAEVDAPTPGCPEQDILHHMRAGEDDFAYAGVINDGLEDGLGVCVRTSPLQLPFVSQWKKFASGDFVLGIEPCNVPCLNRARLRERGLLPMLGPQETREFEIEFSVIAGRDQIDGFRKKIAAITQSGAESSGASAKRRVFTQYPSP